jgi:uncharacterized membrane protein YphA (DoxX/SURF4 family)
MDVVYTLILIAFAAIFWLDGWMHLRHNRRIRRECTMMDEEIDFLS